MRSSGFLLLRGLRLWRGILRWGVFFLLGRIQMDRLRIRLSGRRSAVSDINTDAKRPHDVHPNEVRWGLQANNDNEACSSECFAPLQIQMLRFPCYLQGFSMNTAYDFSETLQGTPLGSVLPPQRESHAGH